MLSHAGSEQVPPINSEVPPSDPPGTIISPVLQEAVAKPSAEAAVVPTMAAPPKK